MKIFQLVLVASVAAILSVRIVRTVGGERPI